MIKKMIEIVFELGVPFVRRSRLLSVTFCATFVRYIRDTPASSCPSTLRSDASASDRCHTLLQVMNCVHCERYVTCCRIERTREQLTLIDHAIHTLSDGNVYGSIAISIKQPATINLNRFEGMESVVQNVVQSVIQSVVQSVT